MLFSLLSLLLLICSSLYNNQSPPLLCFLFLFALKRTVYSLYNVVEYYQLESKSSQYQKVWSYLSVTRLQSVPCSAFDPSWASSALCWISQDFSLWPLARKHKLFVEGSWRNCQPDGSQLVLHQKSRLLK